MNMVLHVNKHSASSCFYWGFRFHLVGRMSEERFVLFLSTFFIHFDAIAYVVINELFEGLLQLALCVRPTWVCGRFSQEADSFPGENNKFGWQAARQECLEKHTAWGALPLSKRNELW